MSCHNCGNKTSSRHKPTSSVFVDIDKDRVPQNTEINMPGPAPQVGNGFGPPGANDAFAAFLEAKRLTYEQLTERRLFQQRMVEKQQEQIMGEMSDSMRQVHVDELIAVANCDKAGIPGMTPVQAIVLLKETLERSDFSFIAPLYPGLVEAVTIRYDEIVTNRLPTRA